MQGSMVLEPRRFESVSVTTLAERIFVGIAGLICLLPAWDFFGRHRVNPFQLGFAPFWLIVLAAGSMAVFLLAGAFLGGTRTVTIDATARTLVLRHRYWRRARNRRLALRRTGPARGYRRQLVRRTAGLPADHRNQARQADLAATVFGQGRGGVGEGCAQAHAGLNEKCAADYFIWLSSAAAPLLRESFSASRPPAA
jgi:hypothetical protein